MANDYGLDKLSTTAVYNSVWRSQMFNIGQKFEINEIRIPLGATVAANMTITPKLYFDDLSSSLTLPIINNTNFSGKRVINFKNPDLKTARGYNNFLLELTWSGTTELPVLLPITIIITTYDDEA